MRSLKRRWMRWLMVRWMKRWMRIEEVDEEVSLGISRAAKREPSGPWNVSEGKCIEIVACVLRNVSSSSISSSSSSNFPVKEASLGFVVILQLHISFSDSHTN